MLFTLTLTVTPHSKQNKVEKIDATHLKVWVTATAEHGKANVAVIKLLARFLDVPPSCITITRGATTRTKRVVVNA